MSKRKYNRKKYSKRNRYTKKRRYSKEDPIEINQSVKDYYDKLLDEYFLGEMEW